MSTQQEQQQPAVWQPLPFDDNDAQKEQVWTEVAAAATAGGRGVVPPAFQAAVDEVERLIEAGRVTETSWLPLVVTLMQAAAAAEEGLTGAEKKATVTELAMRLLQRVPLHSDSVEDRASFLRFARPVVEASIEQLLEAERGAFDLQKATRAAMRAFVARFDNDAAFGQVYDEVKGYVTTAGANFRPEDLIRLVPLIMAATQRAVKKSGAERKALVLALCYRLADEAPIADRRDKAALQLLLQMTLPSTIDTLHDAASGKFAIGKKASKCLSGCFGGCSSRRTAKAPKENHQQ